MFFRVCINHVINVQPFSTIINQGRTECQNQSYRQSRNPNPVLDASVLHLVASVLFRRAVAVGDVGTKSVSIGSSGSLGRINQSVEGQCSVMPRNTSTCGYSNQGNIKSSYKMQITFAKVKSSNKCAHRASAIVSITASQSIAFKLCASVLFESWASLLVSQ